MYEWTFKIIKFYITKNLEPIYLCLTASIHNLSFFNSTWQHTQGIVQRLVCLVQNLLCCSSYDDTISLAQSHTWEPDQLHTHWRISCKKMILSPSLVLTNHHLFYQLAMSKINFFRIAKSWKNLSTYIGKCTLSTCTYMYRYIIVYGT